MTDNTNTGTEQKQEEKKPKRAKLIDELIADAREDVAAAEAKLAALLKRKEDSAKYDAISVGDTIKFTFGRGEKVRTEEGKVLFREGDTLLVQQGEGINIKTVKIAVTAVSFGE